jgi:hypothetical protein
MGFGQRRASKKSAHPALSAAARKRLGAVGSFGPQTTAREEKVERRGNQAAADALVESISSDFLARRIDQRAALLEKGLENYDSTLASEVMNHAGRLITLINRRAQDLAGQLKTARVGQGPVGQ